MGVLDMGKQGRLYNVQNLFTGREGMDKLDSVLNLTVIVTLPPKQVTFPRSLHFHKSLVNAQGSILGPAGLGVSGCMAGLLCRQS